MIVADTNVWIAYLSGEVQRDTQAMDAALENGFLRMAPVVLAEILSDPRLDDLAESALLEVPLLELLPGFWARAGKLRAKLLARSHKPKLADTLIAQTCIDVRATLVTRDAGFRSFVRHGLLLM